jgi:hypothetical protein
MYLGLVIFGIFNCHKYIFKQRGHLLMFYIFSIFVCLGRIGRMGALIANYVMDEEMHTILSNEIDCLIQCSLAIVGLCLVVLMSQLYTYLQWNLIELEAAANRPRHQVIYYDMEAEGNK